MANSGCIVNIAENWVYLSIWKKMGFCKYCRKVGFLSIWRNSGGFVNNADKWGYCQYDKTVGVLSIWQKSGVFINIAEKWHFCEYGKKVGFLSIW
jgi:hypothetical protein